MWILILLKTIAKVVKTGGYCSQSSHTISMRILIAAASYSLVEFAFIVALDGGGNVVFLVSLGDFEFTESQGRAQMNVGRTG